MGCVIDDIIELSFIFVGVVIVCNYVGDTY